MGRPVQQLLAGHHIEHRNCASAPAGAIHGGATTDHWSRSAASRSNAISQRRLMSPVPPPILLTGEEHNSMKIAGRSAELHASGSEWRVHTLFEDSLCHSLRV